MESNYLTDLKTKCLIAAISGYTSAGLSASLAASNAIEIANHISVNEKGDFIHVSPSEHE
jgi:hypothetical protein